MQSQFCHEPGQTVSSHNAADDAVVRQAQRCSNSGPLMSVFVTQVCHAGPCEAILVDNTGSIRSSMSISDLLAKGLQVRSQIVSARKLFCFCKKPIGHS